MNKDELFEKALEEFDEWPYGAQAMIYCRAECRHFKVGCFSDYEYDDFSFLNTDNWQEVCTKQEFEEAKAKIMNNIMQAVNELQGDLVNTCGGYTDAGRFLTINPYGDYFIFNSESMVDDHDRLVCTTKEFNELVSQLETNFEQSITYTEYLKIKEDKKRYWNGKEELEVGMWVECYDRKVKLLFLPDARGDFIVLDEGGEYFVTKYEWLKPIDTRTDEEKFVDDILNTDGWTDVKELIALAYDKLVENKK